MVWEGGKLVDLEDLIIIILIWYCRSGIQVRDLCVCLPFRGLACKRAKPARRLPSHVFQDRFSRISLSCFR